MDMQEATSQMVDALQLALEQAFPADEEEDFLGQRAEVRRNLIVRSAVEVADALILVCGDASPEELDYLTSAVAQAFSQKLHLAVFSRLLRKQLLDEHAKQVKDIKAGG